MASAKQKDITGLAIKPKTGWIYVRKNKTKPGEPGRWSQNKRLEAVTTYLTTGNLALTAKMCNIPDDTMRKWKASDWWKELTDKYHEEDNITLSGKLSKTLEKSIEQINDRLENGDFLYDPRTGKLRRVPVKLRDVHRVCTDMIDKKLILRKQKTTQVVSQETTEGKLIKLAEAFAAFVSGKQPEEKVIIDAEYHELPPEYQEAIQRKELKNAIHDQREERLLEGTSVGTQEETQSSEGQSLPK